MYSSSTGKINQWYYKSKQVTVVSDRIRAWERFQEVSNVPFVQKVNKYARVFSLWKFSELYIYPCVLRIFQRQFQKIKIKKNLGFNRQKHKEKQILKHKMFKFTNVQTQVVILFPFLIF